MRLILTILLAVGLSGCASMNSSEKWPTAIPDRAIFMHAYRAKPHANQSHAALQHHLLWIKRFYQGTMIYPFGWLRMSEQLSQTLDDPAERDEAGRRIRDLGIKIASEWAQSNKVRKINSANVSTWGNGLRTAAERGEALDFIQRVEQDVQGLLEQRLSLHDITRQRYYPGDDYDNF